MRESTANLPKKNQMTSMSICGGGVGVAAGVGVAVAGGHVASVGKIGIPAKSTTEYSMRGCWGFIPPFGLGLPNYPSQIPFQCRYGGYRFSRQGITSLRMDISSSRRAFPIFVSGIPIGWEVKIPLKPSMLNLPSIISVKYFLMRR